MANVNDIAGWRDRTFSSLLAVVLVVGALSTIAITPILLHQGMMHVALADTCALLWTFGIWRLNRLPYHVRVLNFLAVVYALAIFLMLSIGAASMAYLLAPPLIAAILLSLRPAMLAVALGAVSLIGLGATNHISLSVPGWEHDPLKASLVAALNYATIGSMLSLTCSMLLKGLSQSLTDARTSAATLETNQAALSDLNSELELTSAAVSRLNDMVLIAKALDSRDAAQPITFVNDAFLRRTGYARDEIVGHSLRVLQGPDTDQAVVARIFAAMSANEPCDAELMSYTKAGMPFWVEIEMVPFARAGGRPSHWVVVGRDISERRAAADAIHRLAFYDVLTGLPNRRLLTERLIALVAHAHAGGAVPGSRQLQERQRRPRPCHRRRPARPRGRPPPAGGAPGRHRGPYRRRRIRRPARRARPRSGRRHPHRAGRSQHRTRRAGRAAGPRRPGLRHRRQHRRGAAVSAHDLLREADTAMYQAKAGGRNGVVLFETAMLAEAQHKLALERDLAQALDNGELAMHLQLQVDHDGLPAGAELLMRWRRRDGTMVRPDVFIPVAEACGLIVPLGHWVLRQACAAWLALDRAGHPLPLSINVSPLQFRQPDFVEQVRAIFAATGAPPAQFIFEVTEGLLIEDTGQTIARMRELASLGIRFSIDDFGTGYSNLAYLKKMPLYELKIDKSFIHDTPHDAGGTAIVQAILSMAGHLGLRVVAEGIESAAQADYLAGHGRPYMQGFLYHRPMPLDQLIERLGSAIAA
jgi:PAS domain S-box-containing protein